MSLLSSTDRLSNMSGAVILWCAVILMAGCASGHKSSNDAYQATRYSQKHDSGPSQAPPVGHIPDAVPVPEVRTSAGNKTPYVVLGKKYHLLASEVGYRKRGVASWYGSKFHGHATSNGEIYDMYAMTAAHKSLPIPSYVQVTNLTNGKQVIVRVNDRGPFHDNRIIDLSYSAAKKLGYLDQGTAQVEVVGIDAVAWQRHHAARLAAIEAREIARKKQAARNAENALPANAFLQVGAFSNSHAAEQLRSRLAVRLDHPVRVNPPNSETTLYRVRIGPLTHSSQVHRVRTLLAKNDIVNPHLVYEN